MEKAMATHSSTLAWKTPWIEEPGRLQSTGSLSRTWLSNFTFTFHFHALEKEMATHSSVLAWRILATGEPGGLPSMGSHRVGHDWSDLAAAAANVFSLLYNFWHFIFCSLLYFNNTMSSTVGGEGNGTHSNTLAWKISWPEEPGGLQSMRSLRVEHDWATSLSLFTFMHWRRKWQPTPVFLPGES